MAARLSEDERCRVLLLEAGRDLGDDPRQPSSVFSGGAMVGGNWSGIAAPVANDNRPRQNSQERSPNQPGSACSMIFIKCALSTVRSSSRMSS